jgi:hypothetical protein
MNLPVVFAYLDPGTGSYLLQLALAGALGASYAVKHFWSRVKRVLSRDAASTADDRHV